MNIKKPPPTPLLDSFLCKLPFFLTMHIASNKNGLNWMGVGDGRFFQDDESHKVLVLK